MSSTSESKSVWVSYLVAAIGGGLIAVLLNALVIDRILVPEQCRYHFPGQSLSGVLALLYRLQNGHPVQTTLNWGVTAIVGASLGVALMWWLLKRR